MAQVTGWALTAPISGEDARRAAERELSRSEYHRDDPSLISRVISWLFDQIGHLGTASAGQSALAVVAVILIAAVILMIVRAGAPRRAGRSIDRSDDPLRPAAGGDHLRAAEALAAAGRYAESLQEYLRATVDDLENRGVLDPRPGRTADDIARVGGERLPDAAAALRAATDAFGAIWFGGRPATAADAEAGKTAATAVRTARVHPSQTRSSGYAVPG